MKIDSGINEIAINPSKLIIKALFSNVRAPLIKKENRS